MSYIKIYPKIIGISGKMGCGKSEFAKLLIGKHGFYSRKSIGDEVKRECSELFGFPLEWCYDQATKKNVVEIRRQTIKVGDIKVKVSACKKTVREVMQWWGTDVVRKEIDHNYWINKLIASIGKDEHVIVDDIRFPNEAQAVKKAGGVLIRLEPYEGRGKVRGDGHESETALDGYEGFDLVVAPAYGTLGKLAEAIDVLLLKASTLTWQRLMITQSFEMYLPCPHGCRPLKHIKVCAEGCTRRCKVVRQWQKDQEKVEGWFRRAHTVESSKLLAQAC